MRKASQIGLTVWAICEMMAQLMSGNSGLYVLPTDRWMGDFVRNRIDPMIPNVPFYRANYASRGAIDVANVGMKTFFRRRVKFAGANVVNNFYEIPAGWYVIDEVDRCKQRNLTFLDDRLGRRQVKVKRLISNPTFEGVGIDAQYNRSNQQRYLQKCCRCNEWQELIYWQSVVRQIDERRWMLRDPRMQLQINDIAKRETAADAAEILTAQLETTGGGDARCYCIKCHRPISRFTPGNWVAKYQERIISGYTASKVIGDVNLHGAMVRLYQKHMASLYDPTLAQQFRNNDLGEPYREPGSSITEDVLDRCVYEYQPPMFLPWDFNSIPITWSIAGVDVGEPQLHVWVAALINWHGQAHLLTLATSIVYEFEELEDISRRYNVVAWCIDGQPEVRKAREFCMKKPGRYMVFYRKTETGKPNEPNVKTRELNVNRTESIDSLFSMLLQGRIMIPPNWRSLNGGDFKTHLTAPQRVTDYESDPPKIVWTKPLIGDHFLHSGNYLNLAKMVPAA